MFCPVCKLEYRPGFTRCSDCDVPLVESLDGVSVHTNAPQGVAQNPDAAQLLWTGTDSGISGAIAEALDAANISYHERSRDVGVLPGLSKSVYAIIIHARDHNAAKTVLENLGRQLEAPQTDSDAEADGDATQSDSSAKGPNTPADESPETDDADDSFAPEHDYVPEDFDPDEATARSMVRRG